MRHARVLHRDGNAGARSTWGALLVGTLLLTGMGPAIADAGAGDDEFSMSTFAAADSGEEVAARDDADSDEAHDADDVDETRDAGTSADLETPTEDSTPVDELSTEQVPLSERRDAPDTAQLDSPLLDNGGFGTMAVPPATGNNAVINVRVGGDRTGITSVGGLAGVTLRLYNGNASGPTSTVNEVWAECTSNAQGDCSFIVPETHCSRTALLTGNCTSGQANVDRQFWVVLVSVPSQWYANEQLVSLGNNFVTQNYRFQTGSRLRSGQTYESTNTSHFMAATGATNHRASAGTWQISRANPLLPQTCEAGLKVALILDLSGSVGSDLNNLKNSAIGFTEALEGTGSSLALYTFATAAPRNNNPTGQNYGLTAIDGNVGAITNRINGYVADGGTNWDRGIHQAVTSNNNYDLAVVITDGHATYYGNSSGNGWDTRLVETEQAIFSANALKAQNTRVLAVGVGGGLGGNPANLRAISGANPYQPGATVNSADYFQASWQQLAPLLEDVALGATCQASVTVKKTVESYDGLAGPGQGWEFDVTRTTGSGTITPAGPQITGADGRVDYTVQFDSLDDSATLRVAELISAAQLGDGWALASVACTVNDANVATTITNDGVTIPGVRVGDDVDCTFTNTQSLVPNVEIAKRAWTSQGGQEIESGTSLPAGTVVTWSYVVTNTGETPLTSVEVSDDQVGPVECPTTTLAVGASMTCWASGPVTAIDH